MDILQACADPNLFAKWFRRPSSFKAWFAFLAGLFALEMTDEQYALYAKHTGRKHPHNDPCSEAWLIVGRRGGKSFVMALIALYLACFRSYRQYLAPGERATVLVIAADRKQARVILRYVRGMLTNIPILRKLLASETAEAFELNNSVTIEVGTASFRGTRGYTFAAVLADEIAFWRTGDDAANPDFEILSAVRPGLATIPGSMLICASSPYARRGALFDAWKRHWGLDGDDRPLVWRATTREMNPSLPERVVEEALDRDVASAKAEYLAEWRDDVEAFVSLDVVEQCVRTDASVRPPTKADHYVAFVDPSGGSADAMTLAIAHLDNKTGTVLLDTLLEKKPPFSPDSVVWEFSKTLKEYGISHVTGDRYAGEWPREAFRKKGIEYRLADKSRSELYLDMLPVLNSGTVDLLRVQKLINQIVGLERRVTRGGRESIDHPPGGHDDMANAVAGVISIAKYRRHPRTTFGTVRI